VRSPLARAVRRVLPYAVILLAWGLRLCCLDSVPPGWRDDTLINIHALSGEVLAGQLPLYFTGASGHEPLFHYLLAGVHAVLGFNELSGSILSVALGTVTVALTYAFVRRLFGEKPALVASLALSTSFWALMYSRIALRHVNLPPLALGVFALMWTPLLRRGERPVRWAVPLGVVLGLSLYTYPAARLLPVLVVLFCGYLAFFRRDLFRRVWKGYAMAVALSVVLVAPMFLAIARSQGDAAALGIPADPRIVELARPIRALWAGDPGPLIETTWLTLNMFHATGDPEWLYNIAGRPILNWIGALVFWAGLLICVGRWRKPRYFFLILWWGMGLLPTVLSVPPASLSHSILVQPLTYVLPAVALAEGSGWLRRRLAQRLSSPAWVLLWIVAVALFLVPNAYRDLHDYFEVWPQEDMVRFLYRADYREGARYVEAHPEQTDWAMSSMLMGPWDRLAVGVDLGRDDPAVRLFNPERVLVYPAGAASSPVLLTSFPAPASVVERLLRSSGECDPAQLSPALTCYVVASPPAPGGDALGQFENGLELVAADWEQDGPLEPGGEVLLLTTWRVAAPLELPAMPIVANPPPPGVYSGPRLAVFAHLLAPDGSVVESDDGLWVDPLTLRLDDRFVQVHRFSLPDDAPAGPYALELGLYDPLDGQRRAVLDAQDRPVADRVLIARGQDAP
jgi:4-amino-4-deoxy-L-arabinose transferase-like glycosyltransferase